MWAMAIHCSNYTSFVTIIDTIRREGEKIKRAFIRRETTTTRTMGRRAEDATTSTSAASKSNAFGGAAFESYVVERGDTLASVARKTKTRAEVILLLNPHASASSLSRGMVLDVPARELGSSSSALSSSASASSASANEKGGDARRRDEGDARAERRGRRREETTPTTNKTTFSGKLYDRSYPTLEMRSKEVQASVRGKMEALGATKTVGELVGASRERVRAWRRMMMSVVAEKREGMAENIGEVVDKMRRKQTTTPTKSVTSTGRDKGRKKSNDGVDAKEKEKREAEKKRLDAEKKLKQQREKEKREKDNARAAAVAAAEKAKKAAATTTTPKRVETSSRKRVVSSTDAKSDLLMTLLFTSGLGLLGHVLKFVGERYHLAEEGKNDVKEWHPSTLWRWVRERVALVPCQGGGLCLMVTRDDEDADASARPHSKVGSQSNKLFPVNFAQHAAPVEKAMVKGVEKTKAQVQNIVEGMKIRSIDELTDNLYALQEALARGEFESQQDRINTQEKLAETKGRLAEAQNLLGRWVDHSADAAYQDNLKRKVLACWVELLNERYARLRVMSKVYVRWQQKSLAQAFDQWYETAHALRVARLRKEGIAIQDKLRAERQRMIDKKEERAQNQLNGDKEALANAKKNAFEEKLESAAKDSFVV